MIVYTERDHHECAAAKQYLDGVHLIDDTDHTFLIIAQPERITKVENGEIEVVEKPVEPENSGSVWDDLDTAYQAGYNEGYTEGVNSAYDQ